MTILLLSSRLGNSLFVWKPWDKCILTLAFPTLCLQNYLSKVASVLISLSLRASADPVEPVGVQSEHLGDEWEALCNFPQMLHSRLVSPLT